MRRFLASQKITRAMLVLLVPLTSTSFGCPGGNPQLANEHRWWPVVEAAEIPQSPRWSPDGRRLVVTGQTADDGMIYAVEADGSSRYPISAEEAGFKAYHFSPAVSPDGSRVVYSTSRHLTKFGRGDFPNTFGRNFEVETSRLDGSDRLRLTVSGPTYRYAPLNLNVAPMWSPDGSRIAFARLSLIGNEGASAQGVDDAGIYTIAPDGTDARRIVAFAPHRLEPGVASSWIKELSGGPVWSPDGGKLAFVVTDVVRERRMTRVLTPEGRWRNAHVYVLCTVRADGSGLTRLLSVGAWKSERPLSSPAWSPDGQYLAVAVDAEEEPGIYTMRADGTERRRVVPDIVGSHVAWSPDGSELLVSGTRYTEGGVAAAAGTYVAGVYDGSVREVLSARRYEVVRRDDGSVSRVLSSRGPEPPGPASWSPDGGRIAAFFPPGRLVTVRPDGSDLRIVARYDDEDGLAAAGPPPPVVPVDLAPCSAGFVVPTPEANPGLVHDCETLLQVRDTLGGSASLVWSAHVPLADWDGIAVGGSPARVQEVVLTRRGLTGTLPPELGRLAELRTLVISWSLDLRGPIPPELGNLKKLEVLALDNNHLSAPSLRT